MLGYAHDPAVFTPEEMRRAEELAEERYTAARRHYTHLYVAARSEDRPDTGAIGAITEASERAVALAAALRKVQDGDRAAILESLEAGPITDEERALTTDRFTIAQLHAAANPADTWSWSA